MTNADRRFNQKPGHLIRRLQQISFALFMEETRSFAITPVQYSALIAVDNHPGIDQTALCKLIAFDRSTIGDVVRRLEKKKLLKRLNGALDRRTKSLTITPAGRRVIRNIEPAVQATQRLILAPLKPGERGAFIRTLALLVRRDDEVGRAPARASARASSPRKRQPTPKRRERPSDRT